MKKGKVSKKRKIVCSIEIILAILLAFSGAFCIIYGLNQVWIGFSICLAIVIILILVMIPLNYYGIIYECPKCGQKFKANPYKVFLTNFYYDSKYKKLKCPNCKTKDWCKMHYD